MDAPAPAPPRPRRGTGAAWRRRPWGDVAAVGGLALVLRLPAYLAERHLTFDDGVFGASAQAMRDGFAPFADVFSSQGPLFLPLVWLGDLAGLRTSTAPRLLAVVAGVALVLVVHAGGRLVSDRGGALLAGGLTATTASVLWVTGPLAADGPAAAFGALTAVLALRWRHDPTGRRAVALGLAAGAALSVKSLVLPAVVPAAMVLLATRRWRPVLAGAGTAAAVHLAVALPWGLADVWDQSYAYHLEVAGERTPLSNLGKLASTLGDRDLPVVVAAALALVAVVLGRRAAAPPADIRPPGPAAPDGRWATLAARVPTSPDALLLGWLGATVVILLVEHPMWRPHVAHIVPPLALLAARHRPPAAVLGLAALVVVPYHVAHAWPVLQPEGYRGTAAEVVEGMAALPDGALAISDEPGLVWRAGTRPPPDLVDASILRIETGRITVDTVLDAAARSDVCAVVVWSRVRWGSFTELPSALADLGYRVAVDDGHGRRLYVDPACRP